MSQGNVLRSTRPGARLRAALREQILSGSVPVGELIPSIRELSDEHGVCRQTVNRSLQTLADEGLLLAEPRRGYRVLPGAFDPDYGCPIAFVDRVPSGSSQGDYQQQSYLPALRAGAHRHGWSLLTVGAQDRATGDVMRQLRAARASGIIVSGTREIAEAAREIGLPCVAMDWWEEGLGLDVVVQDDFQGGVLAARYLAGRGHERIAWLGHTGGSYHGMARLGGATAELRRAGVRIPPDLCIEASGLDARARAAKLLARPDRPTAVLALWVRVALGALEAARELGLRPGADFEMVGWAQEEDYKTAYVPAFGDGEAVQPAVVWSPRQMGELAVERLAERRRHRKLTPVKISVPVWLKEASND
jgi:DNA-binding LacI/PurR family transcriptional regulator